MVVTGGLGQDTAMGCWGWRATAGGTETCGSVPALGVSPGLQEVTVSSGRVRWGARRSPGALRGDSARVAAPQQRLARHGAWAGINSFCFGYCWQPHASVAVSSVPEAVKTRGLEQAGAPEAAAAENSGAWGRSSRQHGSARCVN